MLIDVDFRWLVPPLRQFLPLPNRSLILTPFRFSLCLKPARGNRFSAAARSGHLRIQLRVKLNASLVLYPAYILVHLTDHCIGPRKTGKRQEKHLLVASAWSRNFILEPWEPINYVKCREFFHLIPEKNQQQNFPIKCFAEDDTLMPIPE